MKRLTALLLAGASLLPVLAHAQTLPDIDVNADRVAQPAPAPEPETAARGGVTILSREDIANYSPRGNDMAQALGGTPGVSLATGGGVSSLPVIRGLNDDRNAVVLGGVPISSACANHMNPPLSYIDPLAAGEVEVITANVPVSKGGDSIGGAIIVKPRAPIFAQAPAPDAKGPLTIAPGVVASGSISASGRSNSGAIGVAGHANVATDHFSLQYDGAWSKAGAYHAGGGAVVRASQYEAQNHSATLAYQNDGHILAFRYDHQGIPYQGFPNQYMDMLGNNGNTFDLSYKGAYGWGRLEANAYYHLTQHYMNFLSDRNAMMPMPMYVNGQDFGYRIKAEVNFADNDLVRLGNELHLQRINEWWPPVKMTTGGMGGMGMGGMGGIGPMCCSTYININNGQRNVLSTFVEWERRWTNDISTLVGMRNDTVWMTTGPVQGYNDSPLAMYGGYGADAAIFNRLNPNKTDVNFDATALVRYTPDPTAQYELGVTRKTRSPSIYERYSWSTGAMASKMIGWFGDGNGYVGNIDLKPEIANTIAAVAAWRDPSGLWSIKAAPYYSYVQDFIDVYKLRTLGVGVNAVNQLRFANFDAELYGFDLSGRARLAQTVDYGDFALTGQISAVRGRRLDGQNLYHMAPLNGQVALENSIALFGGRLSSAVELRASIAKTYVQTLRLEPETPAFAIVNMRTAYEYQNLRFDLGVENLADQLYYSPLGGIDISDWKAGANSLLHTPLAAVGRTVYGGMTVKF